MKIKRFKLQALKSTIVNQTLSSFCKGSLEIKLTVPLNLEINKKVYFPLALSDSLSFCMKFLIIIP